jgi:DNA polymerase-3 subunit beta
MELKPLASLLPAKSTYPKSSVKVGGGKAVIQVVTGFVTVNFILPAPENAEFAGEILHSALQVKGFDILETTETGFVLRSTKSKLTSPVNLAAPYLDPKTGDPLPPPEFTPFPPLKMPGSVLSNEGKDFVRMLKTVSVSVSGDEARPALCHALAQVENGRMVLVSTDGHRLAKVRVPEKNVEIPANSAPKETYLIPSNILDVFTSLSGAEYTFDAAAPVHGTHATLTWGGDDITGFEGYEMRIRGADYLNFPNFNQVIPDFRRVTFSGNGKTFFDALKSLKPLSSKKTRNVRMIVDGTALTFSTTQVIDLGNGKEEFKTHDLPIPEAEVFEDPKAPIVRLGANVDYLLEAFAAYDKVQVYMTDSLSPIVFREGEKEDILVIVMPMRL